MPQGRKPTPDKKVVPFKGDDGLTKEQRYKLRSDELRPAKISKADGLVWDRLAPELSRLGRLEPQYVDVILEYCMVVTQRIELNKFLKKHGETYQVETRNGLQIKSRPEVAQRNETFRQWKSMVAMLGLSPADARGLEAGQGNLFGENPFGELEG